MITILLSSHFNILEFGFFSQKFRLKINLINNHCVQKGHFYYYVFAHENQFLLQIYNHDVSYKNGFNGKQKERVFILTRSHLLFRDVVK
jgi:hypothetical protein